MTSIRPALLSPPPLEAYPFIDVMFRHQLFGIAHIPYGASTKHSFDRAFKDTWFQTPDTLRPSQMAPLQAMNETTLDRLLHILRPKLFGAFITSKADFERLVVDVYESNNRNDKSKWAPCSLEQMASFQLSKASYPEPVHWGQLVSLYNQAPADQQEALHQFFVNCLNRQLESMLATRAPAMELPPSLREAVESKTEDGETLLYSEVEQQWLNEAAFQQVYRATITNKGSAGPGLLVTTAPTLKQVIALTSLFAEAADALCPGNMILIHHLDETVAIAYVEPSGVRTFNNDFSENDHKKLVWDFQKAGIDSAKMIGIRDHMAATLKYGWHTSSECLEQEYREMCRRIAATSHDSKDNFTKTVLSVERTLGLQWSKVHMLEDALGL